MFHHNLSLPLHLLPHNLRHFSLPRPQVSFSRPRLYAAPPSPARPLTVPRHLVLFLLGTVSSTSLSLLTYLARQGETQEDQSIPSRCSSPTPTKAGIPILPRRIGPRRMKDSDKVMLRHYFRMSDPLVGYTRAFCQRFQPGKEEGAVRINGNCWEVRRDLRVNVVSEAWKVVETFASSRPHSRKEWQALSWDWWPWCRLLR